MTIRKLLGAYVTASFADQVHQMIDGRLSASSNDATDAAMVVEAVDSGLWEVWARDGCPEAVAAARRVAAALGD